MTRVVAVLPFVYRPYYDAFLATSRLAEHPEVEFMPVDNTVTNRGIMAAQNEGIRRTFEVDADWMVILSAAIRFGEPGGLDFIDLLFEKDDHYVVHAASNNVAGGRQDDGTPGGGVNAVFGWHLTAFKREVFENVGTFDENFSPYGLDDVDLSIRIQKHYKGRKTADGVAAWNTYPIEVSDTTMSHSIQLAGVVSPYEPKAAYFTRKWGRTPADWQNPGWDHPFGDESKGLDYWPAPDDPRSIHNNELRPQ